MFPAKRINVAEAKKIVQKQFPTYVIEWCIRYKSDYIVMAHPDDGPEDKIKGAYPDPFYAVNTSSGRIRSFVPMAESDMGRSFFDSAMAQLKGIQNG